MPLKMAPKFSRDRRVRDRTTIGEWHRDNTEAHRALLVDASILEPTSAPCTIRPLHTRRACILMQAETEHVAMRHSTRFFLKKKKLFFEIPCEKSEFSELLRQILPFSNFEKHLFPQIFFLRKKSSFVQISLCGNLFLS